MAVQQKYTACAAHVGAAAALFRSKEQRLQKDEAHVTLVPFSLLQQETYAMQVHHACLVHHASTPGMQVHRTYNMQVHRRACNYTGQVHCATQEAPARNLKPLPRPVHTSVGALCKTLVYPPPRCPADW